MSLGYFVSYNEFGYCRCRSTMSSDEVRNATCNEDFESAGEGFKEKAGDIEVKAQEENKWLEAENARLAKELKAALVPLIKLNKGPHEESKPKTP